MYTEHSKGPFCQSCRIPMEKPEDFGTDIRGFKNNDYCTHCFEDGKFVDPHITIDDMIDRVSNIIAEKIQIPKIDAEQMLRPLIRTLKRWSP